MAREDYDLLMKYVNAMEFAEQKLLGPSPSEEEINLMMACYMGAITTLMLQYHSKENSNTFLSAASFIVNFLKQKGYIN